MKQNHCSHLWCPTLSRLGSHIHFKHSRFNNNSSHISLQLKNGFGT